MKEDKVLITGSCGLIGSEAARFYLSQNYKVMGIDNNNRGYWFGQEGSVKSLNSELSSHANYKHENLSITDCEMPVLVYLFQPDIIVHCAAQPSHEKSCEIPLETFEVNTLGTINLLESVRKFCPDAIFVFMSTNKVYPHNGLRTPFGATKYAADIMVQEYGNYFGLKTVCFRCGCITGAAHRAVEQHGYLNYLCKCALEGKKYTIYGHNGHQVRDNLHARDVVRAIDLFAQNPKYGAVYDLGGGEANSCTLLEAIKIIEEKTGKKLETDHGPERRGDFDNWVTDYSAFERDYGWTPQVSLDDIFDELIRNQLLP